MYLHGFKGKPNETHLFKSTAAYNFGKDSNLSLKVEYQNGNVPLTQEDVKNLVVGIGLKI